MSDESNNGYVKTGENDLQTSYAIRSERHKHDLHWATVSAITADSRMQLASQLMQLGAASSVIFGEDSSGRAISRLLTPEEVVDRAMEMTEILYQRCLDKGWAYMQDKSLLEKMLLDEAPDFGVVPGRK